MLVVGHSVEVKNNFKTKVAIQSDDVEEDGEESKLVWLKLENGHRYITQIWVQNVDHRRR